MPAITVWGVGTPRTLRVHWALHELGMPYETVPVTPRSPVTQGSDYVALNASRKIPTLVHGDFVLTESGAIVNHLLRNFGERVGLHLPTESRGLARYEEWCFFALMELDATSEYVIRRHLDLHASFGEAPTAVTAARAYWSQMLKAAAQRLGHGPFAMGARFSGADILLVSCLDCALRRGVEIPSSLLEYRDRVAAREAYGAAVRANRPQADSQIAPP